MTAALHVLEWKLMGFRRQWRATLPTAVLNPLLLLVAMGIGVGSIIDDSTGASRAAFGGASYLAFVGTGLLATTAMTVTSMECCWPVLYGFVRFRSFQVMASTPTRPIDIVVGIALFVWLRAAVAACGVAMVLLFVAETRSTGLVLAVVFAATSALALGMPMVAFAATRRGQDSFPLIQRFVVTPLLLFGGALFPVDDLPVWVAAVVQATPLWHGIELCRGAVLSTLGGWATAGHLAYLSAWVGAGILASAQTFRRRLEA